MCFKRDFGRFFRRGFSAVPLTEIFAVFTESLTTDQSVKSIRVTQIAIKVLEAVYPEKPLMQRKVLTCPTGSWTYSNFSCLRPKFHCFD